MGNLLDELNELGTRGRPPADQTYPGKIKPRDEVLVTFRKRGVDRLKAVDGKLNAAEFQIALDRLGIRRTQVGEWLGMSRRTGTRYAAADQEPPVIVGKLLTLMLRLGLKPEQV